MFKKPKILLTEKKMLIKVKKNAIYQNKSQGNLTTNGFQRSYVKCEINI